MGKRHGNPPCFLFATTFFLHRNWNVYSNYGDAMASSTSDFAGYRIDSELVAVRPQTETALIWAMAHFIDNGGEAYEFRFVIPYEQFEEALYNIRAAGFSIVIEEMRK